VAGRGRKAGKAAANVGDAAAGAAKAADELPAWASGLTPVQYSAVLKGAERWGLEPEAFAELRQRAKSAGATSEDFKKGREHLMALIASKEDDAAGASSPTPTKDAAAREAFAPPEKGWPSGTESFASKDGDSPGRDEMLGFLLRPVEQGGAGFTEAQIGGFNDAEIADTYKQVKPVVEKAGSKRGGKTPPAEDITSNVDSDPAARPPSGENDTLPSTEGAVEAATKQASGKRGPGRPRKNPQAAAPAPAAKTAAAATTAKPNPADFSTVNWNQFQPGRLPSADPSDWSNLNADTFQRALNAGAPNPTPVSPPSGGNMQPPPTEKAAPWYEQAGMKKPFIQSAGEFAYKQLPNIATLAALGYGGYRLLTSGGQQGDPATSQAMPRAMAEEVLRQRGLLPPLQQANPADYGPSPEDRIRQMRGQ
jgi:hypothetical protein